jgi:NAD+ synthetase
MKIALAQIDPANGAFAANTQKLLAFAREARDAGAEKILFPEGALEGFSLPSAGDAAEDVAAARDAFFRNLPGGISADLPVHFAGRVAQPPYRRGSFAVRLRAAAETRKPLLQPALVGGDGRDVYDGGALLATGDGRVWAGPRFEEGLFCVETDADGNPLPPDGPQAVAPEEPWGDLYRALVLATGDYIRKCGARGVLVALSGGMDSALVAAIAVDALGPEKVFFVTFPSRYSSEGTRSDAHRLAANLGVPCREIPIGPAVEALSSSLAFAPDAARALETPDPRSLEAENLQARVRGTMAMSLANRMGLVMLETSNLSESLVGYCTLYGDTCGGFSPLLSVLKTDVYRLARWRNRGGEVIPESIIARAPSAELRDGQKDSDSLPPYDVLDPILEILRTTGSPRAAVAAGHDEATVGRVWKLMLRSEFKRRQTPEGPETNDIPTIALPVAFA